MFYAVRHFTRFRYSLVNDNRYCNDLISSWSPAAPRRSRAARNKSRKTAHAGGLIRRMRAGVWLRGYCFFGAQGPTSGLTCVSFKGPSSRATPRAIAAVSLPA
jgi:hypothetical protein